MAGENNDDTNEDKNLLEVDDAKNNDAADAIIGGKEDKEVDEEEKDKKIDKDKKDLADKDKDDDDKGDDGEGDDDDKDKKFYKKVGTREFDSEEEYDKHVNELTGTNSNFAGEIKRLGGDPKNLGKEKKEEDKDKDKDKEIETETKKKKTSEEIYYDVEGIRFHKQFPEAKDYKEEMAVLLRKGKANIEGEPNFAIALAKSLRADGKEIPEKLLSRIRSERGIEEKESRTASKKIMRSGGSQSAPSAPSQESYTDEDKDDLSDFANKSALDQIR